MPKQPSTRLDIQSAAASGSSRLAAEEGPKSPKSTAAARRRKNADAQAEFRVRRANYIANLEETVRTLEGAVRTLQNACRDARDDSKELREENARLRAQLEGQHQQQSHEYIPPPPQTFAPTFQGSPHVPDLPAPPQPYHTYSNPSGDAPWTFDMNFDHTTPDFSPLSSNSGSLPHAPSPSYIPDLGNGGQSGSYYAPSSRSLSPSPFGEANPQQGPHHASSLDSHFNHLSIFGAGSAASDFPMHFPQSDNVEWNPAMLYAASSEPNPQQPQQQYEEQQRELDRHETVKANKARRHSETADGGNHDSLDRNDTLKATARPTAGRDHRYRPYSAADASGHHSAPFVGKLEEDVPSYGHFRSGSSASSSSYNSILDSSQGDVSLSQNPSTLVRGDSRRHSYPVASTSAIEDSPSPSHLENKDSDEEALSYTLAVLKSQAFGTVRKSRVRTKRPTAANDAAKVAMHALNARALSLGLDIVPLDGSGTGAGPNGRRLRSQHDDMDKS